MLQRGRSSDEASEKRPDPTSQASLSTPALTLETNGLSTSRSQSSAVRFGEVAVRRPAALGPCRTELLLHLAGVGKAVLRLPDRATRPLDAQDVPVGRLIELPAMSRAHALLGTYWGHGQRTRPVPRIKNVVLAGTPQSPPGDLNPQPLDYKSSALPIELGGHRLRRAGKCGPNAIARGGPSSSVAAGSTAARLRHGGSAHRRSRTGRTRGNRRRRSPAAPARRRRG